MKKFITILTIAAAFMLAETSNAQVYGYATFTVPTVLAAGTTNYTIANAPTLGQLKQQNVAISSVISSCASAGATNVYAFAPSVDGVNYNTNTTALLYLTNTCTAAASGAGSIGTYNYNVQGYGYLKLIQIVTTATTGSVTNGLHSYGIKIGCP